jgi:Family of unknown function (DUF6404)
VTHEQKVACFEKLIRDRGYWVSNAIPPLCRLLWRMGYKTPPPCFLSFPVAAISAGLAFAFIYGAFMWLFVWPANVALSRVLTMCAVAGILYGLAMATFWRIRAKQLDLPAWNDFPRAKPGA